MTLYEADNGWIGESYVRVYVWAPDEVTARMMADAAFAAANQTATRQIEALFDSSAAPFCTIPSGSGWYIEPS